MLKFIAINKEKVSVKQGVHKQQRWESLNIVATWILHVHNTAEL